VINCQKFIFPSFQKGSASFSHHHRTQAKQKSPCGAEGEEKARYSQGLDDDIYNNKATAFCVCVDK